MQYTSTVTTLMCCHNKCFTNIDHSGPPFPIPQVPKPRIWDVNGALGVSRAGPPSRLIAKTLLSAASDLSTQPCWTTQPWTPP